MDKQSYDIDFYVKDRKTARKICITIEEDQKENISWLISEINRLNSIEFKYNLITKILEE